MDMSVFYRCPICSDRTQAIVVRITEKAKHIAMHEAEKHEPEEAQREFSS